MELIEQLLPIGRYGPYPQHRREEFEGAIWRFRAGRQWREMPEKFGDWSSGPVEGRVNDLKAIKRSMFGRAKPALLRKRLLLIAASRRPHAATPP